MNRRRFLAFGGVIGSTAILTTFATGESDSGEATGEGEGVTSTEQRTAIDESKTAVERTETGDASAETEAPSTEDLQEIAGSSETALGEIEEAALDSPDNLTEEEIETLLSAHENHSACPICQSFQPGGVGPTGMGDR